MLLWPPLIGTKLSPVAPRSWALPNDHTPGNRHDRRAKPGEGLRCCVYLHTRLRMQASPHLYTGKVYDLLFTDECPLNTVMEEDMQRSMNLFATGCSNFRLTISTATTVVMNQPLPNVEYNVPRINFNDAQLKNVETFAYLGNMLSNNTSIDDEVAQRISKVSQAFGRLQAT
ncbi:unnamed protein product [Schistocephalus solidus]|uniref:Reverse transcriptase domain-containing protein n=1 Tax=Schistocephalus solidus TaxID=70667 RepID=A0A183SHR4_SCHSO|nr:unnamed protein product [Schistocephalus solidus]